MKEIFRACILEKKSLVVLSRLLKKKKKLQKLDTATCLLHYIDTTILRSRRYLTFVRFFRRHQGSFSVVNAINLEFSS